MIQLSVNVNKIATLRNARGENNPDLLKTSLDIIAYGAQGITVHPRPDERHIRRKDVYDIARHIQVEFNIEGYPSEDFLSLIHEIKPAQCTLVPDPPDVLTSNAGWSISSNKMFLKKVIAQLHADNIRSSLFIDPYALSPQEIEDLKEIGTDRVELYTKAYADAYETPDREKVLAFYQKIAHQIHENGVALNAGHDLSLVNLHDFITAISFIEEVSIGHALICDALYFGLKDTVARYLACLHL